MARKDATIAKLWHRMALVKAEQHRTLDHMQRGFTHEIGLNRAPVLETIERELAAELRRHGEPVSASGVLSTSDDRWLQDRIAELQRAKRAGV